MLRRSTGLSISPRRRDAGFTLVEVLVALALVTVTGGVGVSAICAAVSAAARGVTEARWNAAVLLFDRAARSAVAAIPVSFWDGPPRLEAVETGFRLTDSARGGRGFVEFRFVREPAALDGPDPGPDRAVTLLVIWSDRRVAVPGVCRISFSPIFTGEGRAAGFEALLEGPGARTERFALVYGGQYL
ncbi:MAG TPA: prepilin-type N-terminal cleavage/methylation domain-containing protein [Spirochaetia bacterium]|nr:prepilin-type N-terminal cleavage/methylation domain-containing protein [Spirochaetia bacterium]